MADEITFDMFKECAVTVFQVPFEKVVPDARFDSDLGVDSMDLVEFFTALEETFGVRIDEAELEGVETVGQVFGLVSAQS